MRVRVLDSEEVILRLGFLSRASALSAVSERRARIYSAFGQLV
jgi:hypothetical protein